jgi:hypothetical protein
VKRVPVSWKPPLFRHERLAAAATTQTEHTVSKVDRSQMITGDKLRDLTEAEIIAVEQYFNAHGDGDKPLLRDDLGEEWNLAFHIVVANGSLLHWWRIMRDDRAAKAAATT